MKYYRSLLMAILLLSATAHAIQPKIEIVEQFDNLRMVAFLSMEDISNNPEWDPDRGAPPMTVAAAIQAVKDFTKTPGTIKEIELRPVPKHAKQWHYLIKLANDAMKTRYDIYVVLMNGKVIPAIIEPQGYK